MATNEQTFADRLARIENGQQWAPDGVIHAQRPQAKKRAAKRARKARRRGRRGLKMLLLLLVVGLWGAGYYTQPGKWEATMESPLVKNVSAQIYRTGVADVVSGI